MEKYFTEEHEWIIKNEKLIKMGITEYAAGQLGDITFIDLPQSGTELSKGEILCEIESVKAASNIYMPVSGKVKTVNETLKDSPEMLNTSPESDAWIIELEDFQETELSDLMDETSYKKYIENLG